MGTLRDGDIGNPSGCEFVCRFRCRGASSLPRRPKLLFPQRLVCKTVWIRLLSFMKRNIPILIWFLIMQHPALCKSRLSKAPADLFFSAGDKQMNALVEGGLVSDHKVLLKNQLVVVVPSDSKVKLTTITQLTDKAFKKVAVGQPESVPAGQYAQQSLTAKKVWDPLQSKLVFAKDVRQVLSYVETGNADAGFVYKTDALTSKKTKIALTVGPHVHKAINYPAGIVKSSKNQKAPKELYSYLQSKEANDIFVSYGFLLP